MQQTNQPDTRCRECGAIFEVPHIARCPWCASNKLQAYSGGAATTNGRVVGGTAASPVSSRGGAS